MSEARDLRQAVAFEHLWDRLLHGESAREYRDQSRRIDLRAGLAQQPNSEV
jgi:hypothetical protein